MATSPRSKKASHEHPVRVRLKRKVSTVDVSGLDLTFKSHKQINRSISLPQMKKATISVIKQGQDFLWQVRLAEENGTLQFKGRELEITGEMVRLGVEPSPAALLLHADSRGDIDVVAELDLETYLAGVLPSEMPASWPLEALKAQLIASRSYTLDMLEKRKHWHYHVEASVHDQVFRMLEPGPSNKAVRDKVQKAIKETRGQYLSLKGGRALRAYYHADCGGQTENPKYVWGTNISTGTVKDPSCPLSPHASWQVRLPRVRLRQIFSQYFSLKGGPDFKSVLVAQRTPSGRVDSLQVLYDGRKPLKISAQKFRELVGFSELKSTNFRFHWFGKDMQIDGKGHGHGVGLCQYGARSLARRGMNYQDILKHYYPKARLEGSDPTPILSSSSEAVAL